MRKNIPSERCCHRILDQYGEKCCPLQNLAEAQAQTRPEENKASNQHPNITLQQTDRTNSYNQTLYQHRSILNLNAKNGNKTAMTDLQVRRKGLQAMRSNGRSPLERKRLVRLQWSGEW